MNTCKLYGQWERYFPEIEHFRRPTTTTTDNNPIAQFQVSFSFAFINFLFILSLAMHIAHFLIEISVGSTIEYKLTIYLPNKRQAKCIFYVLVHVHAIQIHTNGKKKEIRKSEWINLFGAILKRTKKANKAKRQRRATISTIATKPQIVEKRTRVCCFFFPLVLNWLPDTQTYTQRTNTTHTQRQTNFNHCMQAKSSIFYCLMLFVCVRCTFSTLLSIRFKDK